MCCAPGQTGVHATDSAHERENSRCGASRDIRCRGEPIKDAWVRLSNWSRRISTLRALASLHAMSMRCANAERTSAWTVNSAGIQVEQRTRMSLEINIVLKCFSPFFLTANEVLLCGYINAPGSLSLPSPTYRHTHTHMLSSDVSIILAFAALRGSLWPGWFDTIDWWCLDLARRLRISK